MDLLKLLGEEIAVFAEPALYNIYFAAVSIPIGFVFAVLMALGKASRNAIVRRLCSGYVYAFRGSPFFIQLFMFYTLALSLNLTVWKPLGIDAIVLNPMVLGPAILALNTTAYTAEILYGALLTVPRGEIEAARAFGMTRMRIFRSVTWPHLIRIAWPAYTNEVVFLFHATALVYLTLPVIDNRRDLMAMATERFERDFNAVLHYSVAAAYFLAVSMVVFFIFGLIYRRLMRHMPGERRVRFAPRWLRQAER